MRPEVVQAVMFGWFSAAAARASCSKRRSRSGSAEDDGQDLDGDVSLEPRVARPVHLSHATRAERRDLVGTEAYSGGECHPMCENSTPWLRE